MPLFLRLFFCVLSASIMVVRTLIIEGEVHRTPNHAIIELSLCERGMMQVRSDFISESAWTVRWISLSKRS